jgi:hypothetical protein
VDSAPLIETVEAALRALDEERWSDAASLIDADDLRARASALPVARDTEFPPHSPRDAVAAWLAASDLRARMGDAEGFAMPRRAVIGAVMETPELGHVLYRESWQGVDDPSAGTVRTVTLRRAEGQWRIRLEHDFFGYTHHEVRHIGRFPG